MPKIKLAAKPPFLRVGLAGLGLIGGSLAKAFIPFGGMRLYAFDRHRPTIEAARRTRRFAGVTDQLETFLNWPLDLAYLCLPVQRNLELVKIMGRRQVPYAVTDAGSTKASIARAALDSGLNFCGGHPIAGREVSGYQHADADLLRGCLYILTPPKQAGPETQTLVGRLQALHELLSCRIHVMTPEDHDRIYGLVSHLPYLSATALAGVVLERGGPDALSRSGSGFRDSTRIGAAAPEKWVEIVLDNASNLEQDLDGLIDKLSALKMALQNRDSRKLMEILEPAAAFRRGLPPTPEPKA